MSRTEEDLTASYPYRRDDIETQRLQALSDLYDKPTVEWLRRNIPVGSKVLEIGMGDGQLAEKIIEIIGEEGHYTGVEKNEVRVLSAAARLSMFSNKEVIHGDALHELKRLPPRSFDVVFFRWFLWIIPEDARLVFLKSLLLLLKPGGIALSEEADMTALKSIPEHPTIARYKDYTKLRCEQNGHPLALGPQMASLFEAAGFDKDSEAERYQPEAKTFEEKLLPYLGACSARTALIEAGVKPDDLELTTTSLYKIALDGETKIYTTENYRNKAIAPGH